jgi:aminoglycoside phosphotransferase (APT) family kinase protein
VDDPSNLNELLAPRLAQLIGARTADLRVRPRPPLAHQSNRLYDVWIAGRHLIAKEFLKPDEFATAPLREHRALERIAPLDIAPQPVALAAEPQPPLGPVVVYEFLEGTSWGRGLRSAAELAALAELWLVVHRVPTDGLWPSRSNATSLAAMEPWFRERFAAYGRWADAEFPEGRRGLELCLERLDRLRPVAAELAELPAVRCFCRPDARFANVIARPGGRLAMVDWEDSGLRDPAIDLADLTTHAEQEDLLAPPDLRAFLDPYLAARAPLDPHLPRRYALYLAAFPLFWLAGLLAAGVRRATTGALATWGVNDLPPNQRLRRYLARATAWPSDDFSAELAALESLRFFPEPSVYISQGE